MIKTEILQRKIFITYMEEKWKHIYLFEILKAFFFCENSTDK